MKKHSIFPVILAFSAFLTVSCQLIAQDDYWTPKGAPGDESGKIKTLEQLEPRVIISSLPFSITNSGSYYLIKSLIGSPNSNGITIAANEVKIDLNGFSLNGGPNTLSAIIVISPSENIAIRNGVIRNWSQFGIDATNAMDLVLNDVKAFGNGFGGIYAGQNSFIERCSAYGNGYSSNSMGRNDAIYAYSFSTIKDCKVRGNTGAGIHSYYHSRIIGCTAVGCGADGIHLEDYCTIKDCTVSQNRIGISVSDKCRVTENTIGENGINPIQPDYSAPGIFLSGNNNVVERNIISYNNTGIKFAGSGNLVMNNYVSKSISPNSDFTGNINMNYVGPVSSFTSNYGEFTNNNPWMNFRIP